jgi:predicted transcriptional regulator
MELCYWIRKFSIFIKIFAMDIQLEKQKLIKMLTETNDVSIINAIKNVFKTQKKDFWEELTQEQRDEIEEGEREIERGEYVTFESILDKYEYKPKR